MKYLVTLIVFLHTFQAMAADKTLAAGEIVTLTSDTTWDNLYSTATSGNWAVVSGPYSVTVTGATEVQYVSFQNTGAVNFQNETLVVNSVFDGNTDINIGTSSTPLSASIIVEDSDFRNQTNSTALTFYSVTGDSTGTYRVKGNTFYYTEPKVILFTGRNDVLFTENILYNLQLGNLDGSNWNVAGGHTYSNNFFSFSSELVGDNKTLVVNAGKPSISFDNNYCYYDYSNPHPFSITSSSSETGTDFYTNNIIEVVFNYDGANIFNSNSYRGVEISGNLHIGSGSLVNAVGSSSREPIMIKNNTSYSTLSGNAGDGLLYLSESGPSLGVINIVNNLISGITDPGEAINSITATQTITSSDYNAFHNVTNPYESVSVTFGSTNDILGTDPQFVDPARNLLNWYSARYFDGTPSKAEVVDILISLNGYSDTSKTQSNTPPTYGILDLISYVKAGFEPQATSVLTGADDGGPIGAVTSATLVEDSSQLAPKALTDVHIQ